METSQISKGMIRAVLGLRDLSLDVPAASSSLAALVDLILQVAPSPFAEELLCACMHPPPPHTFSSPDACTLSQSKLITAEFKDKILQMKPVLETA